MVKTGAVLDTVNSQAAFGSASTNTGTGTLGLSREAGLVDYPAGQALVQIGAPAIPTLVLVLDHGNLYERWNAAYALNLIGLPKAKNALRDHLKREPDSTMRDFIENALS